MNRDSFCLRNCRAATMTEGGDPYGLENAVDILVADGRIQALGPTLSTGENVRNIQVNGRLVTPGLIDCHSHLVFTGERSGEFERRLQGQSYAEIAREGGGIGATVKAVRKASEEQLFELARTRVEGFMQEGVTTFEIKSGYGLDFPSEEKMLRVARRLGSELPCDVVTSFLGAHALPPEYQGRSGDYVKFICKTMLPELAEKGLVDAVDGFCESIAFSVDEIASIFKVAKALDLPIKLHAEQLSHTGGAIMAARMGALSCDHLEYLEGEGIAAMASAGSVAVLLPGAFYFLQETRKPPVAALRKAGVPMALASDLNPGSSPLYSLLATLNLGVLLFGLTPEEALPGVTRIAAKALGLTDRGALAPGMRADIALWQAARPAELCASLGRNPCIALIKDGKFLFMPEEWETRK